MSTHNICFHGEKKKKYLPDTPSYLELFLFCPPTNGKGDILFLVQILLALASALA